MIHVLARGEIYLGNDGLKFENCILIMVSVMFNN